MLREALKYFNKGIPAWYGWIDLEAGEVYSNLQLLDETAIMPTESEVNAKIAELEIQQNRANNYPSVQEQLDYIFHNGLDAWKTDIIQPIKDQFPKP